MTDTDLNDSFDTDIAVVGMAGRFAGARNLGEYWKNLRDGVESIQSFSDEQLLAAGVDPAELADPNYVKSGAVLPDMEMFDAPFFGFSPREASVMDPQHRHFLECAWEALEDAGHVPEAFDGAIGVFGGSGHNAYMPYNLLTNPKIMSSMGFFLVRHTGNDKDFLTTRVSYLLNLKGPSVNVQTACSTSLVAIHMGVQSLLARECDMALAGGVTIELPHRHGYLYREGEILSPDGHCHAFDASSQGTVFGSGVGIVVLRRLSDALADGDHIHAVIKGSAVNNDGAMKVGYLAPSVDGQAQSIAEAMAVAGVTPDSISYVETHGTGTPVGDPIEVAALTQAFRQGIDAVGFCGIGSVKTNIGHTDTAAGIASFMKVALAMQHRQLPPSLHFETPNPACEFETSPFYVNATLKDWTTNGQPRRAGVSSLGVGGTNAHIILQEAPAVTSAPAARAAQLLLLSAKTEGALDANTAALAEHLASGTAAPLADVAWTLQVGRQAMKQRRFVVASDAADAAQALSAMDDKRVVSLPGADGERSVAFMFAGGGAQYPTMGADLYRSEPVFRAAVDECLAHLQRISSVDYRSLLFPEPGAEAQAAMQLEKPSRALPALFTVQYAQARLWMSWGLKPAAMIGHSMGEYTAAHLAGVFTLADALALVELRGRLFESLPEGGMLSVSISAQDLSALMPAELSIAAVNGPALAVASGPVRFIEQLEKTLQERDIDCVRVRISVAAHSSMLEPILRDFRAFFERLRMSAPTLPFVSNLSGTWVTAAEATDPGYWVRHLRETVQFARGLEELLQDDSRILLEVGPGRTLATLSRQHPRRPATQAVLNSLRHPDEKVSDQAFVLGVLGRLWAAGAPIDWAAFHGEPKRRRVSLPTYRFDHQRHWIEPGRSLAAAAPQSEASATLERRADLADWFYQPVWQQRAAREATASPASTLILADALGLGESIAQRLRDEGRSVALVRPGTTFGRDGDAFTVVPDATADHAKVLSALVAEGRAPQQVLHLWTLSGSDTAGGDVDRVLRLGFHSLLALAQAIGSEDLADPIELGVVTDHLQQVAGETGLQSAKATLLGPCTVIPHEFENVRARCIDVMLPRPGSWQIDRLADAVLAEYGAPAGEAIVALRPAGRWLQTQQPVRLPQRIAGPRRERPVVMITGGLGGVAMALAEEFAHRQRARLVLLARSAMPPREQWESRLAAEGEGSALGRRIRQLLTLEARGAELLIVQADVCDKSQMQAAVAQARQRFGAIDVVLHTAGVLADGVIQLKEAAIAQTVLAPKVQGTLVLDEVLRDQPPEHLVLFSSISSFSGLTGQVDYASANAFLDAFARERMARDGGHTVAVNWSAWADVGMAAQMAQQLGLGLGAAGSAGAGTPVDHPLLDRCLVDGPRERVYATDFSIARHWLLDEHRVRGGDALIPGTGYLELVRAAARLRPRPGVLSLRDVVFLAPFAVGPDEQRELRLELSRDGADAETFRVRSVVAGTPVDHVRGRVVWSAAERPAAIALDSVRTRCSAGEKVLAEGEQPLSLNFGPRWSNLKRVRFGQGEALAELELPARFATDLESMALHPPLLDLATGGSQALIPGYDERRDFFVPASYGVLTTYAPLQAQLFSHVRLRADDSTADLAVFDVSITDANGQVLATAEEFTMIRVRDRALLAAPPRVASASAAPPAAERPHATANHVLELGLRDGIRAAEGATVLMRVIDTGVGPQIIVSPQDLHALLARLAEPPAAAASATHAAPAEAPGKDVAPLEAALASHEALKESAASASQGRVVAYVVHSPDHSVTVSELRRHVRALVPEDLVPQSFVELDELPRLADGAIDRARLPDPFAKQEAAVGPRNEMEKVIATLWQELLGVDAVGVHDNFFDIGGHSLLSVRFISRLDKKIGVRLQHEHVVVNTLEQLASKCSQMAGGASASGSAPAAAGAAPVPAAMPTPAAAPAAPAKPKGLFGAVKQAVMGSKSS